MKKLNFVIKSIVLGMTQVLGADMGILVGTAKEQEYDGNNRPTGKVVGTKYVVACPKRQYATITVKVPDMVPIVTQETLDETDDPIWVTFEGFSGRLYLMDEEVGLTCKAEKAILVKAGGKGHEKN